MFLSFLYADGVFFIMIVAFWGTGTAVFAMIPIVCAMILAFLNADPFVLQQLLYSGLQIQVFSQGLLVFSTDSVIFDCRSYCARNDSDIFVCRCDCG